MKGKPHPWGLKVWGCCSASGILSDFSVYQGGTGEKNLSWYGTYVTSFSSCVKLFHQTKTTKALPTIFFLQHYRSSIFFSDGPTLWEHCSNCLAGRELEDEKSLAKRGRGCVDARVEKEKSMVIVKWYPDLILLCS